MFTTFIFGNGLGRAIDPYFELHNGLKSVWKNELSKDVKNSIRSCLEESGGGRPKRPTSEEQLLKLHEVTNACRKLRQIEPGSPKWLTNRFRKFPEAIDEFIGRVSFHFHRFHPEDFPPEYSTFVKGLADYIKKNPCHLATLNYDNLLYQPLIGERVLDGYSGHLIDGFTNSGGFSTDNMNRLPGRRDKLGWYLHLHGSPLFYNSGSKIRKYTQSNLETSFDFYEDDKRHVVLCHTKDKPSVIDESKILKSYWRYLGKALKQSSTIHIIGYGGADDHLNKKISSWIENKKYHSEGFVLKILEWKNPKESLKDRKSFWADKLSTGEFKISGSDLLIDRRDNILELDWSAE